jgi:hypothetical protein
MDQIVNYLPAILLVAIFAVLNVWYWLLGGRELKPDPDDLDPNRM